MAINRIFISAIIAMAVISFINLFGITAAGISVCIGVVFFFINNVVTKQGFEGSGLDLKAIRINLQDRSIWFWITLPIIMDAVSILLSQLFLPGYIKHVITRASIFISFDSMTLFLLLQLLVLALGEEIAWRAFFQKQLGNIMTIAPVVFISSFLFAIGHITSGDPVVVMYDVFFVFINSILYGIIFYKTNNAWISTISHFAANLFSIIVFMFI